LLVVPPAVAQTLTPHPGLSIAVAVLVGLLVVWVSLFVAYYSPYPIGFFLTSAAFAVYLAARGWVGLRGVAA
jgi:zinc/manganese transport system permease protein